MSGLYDRVLRDLQTRIRRLEVTDARQRLVAGTNVTYSGGGTVEDAIDDHIADTDDAHDASAISVTPFSTIAATNVQAALEEIVAESGGGVTDHGALTGLADDDHPQYATNTEFDDHSARHESGGADAIKLDDLATPDDNTDLNVSTSRHGLTPKLPNDSTKYLDGTGAWSVPAGGGGGGLTQAYAGYNTEGGSFESAGVNSKVYAKQITLANACLIPSIGAYISSASGSAFGPAVALYSDNAGTPDKFLGGPDEGVLVNLNATARWVDMPLGIWVPAGTYWLLVRTTDQGASVVCQIAYDGSGSDKTAQGTANVWPDWSNFTSATTTSNKYSIRANTIR